MQTTYTLHCSGCHGAQGHGVPDAGIPDLHDSGAYVAIPAGRAYLVQVPGLSQSRLAAELCAGAIFRR
jgi:mono/diheme cytochrome c family protein